MTSKGPARCGRAGVDDEVGAERPRVGDGHSQGASRSRGAAPFSVTTAIS